MSTADSQLLVVTSAFSEDISNRILKRDLSPRAQVNLSRFIVFLVGGAAFALALAIMSWVSVKLMDFVEALEEFEKGSFSPKLLEQVRNLIRLKHYSIRNYDQYFEKYLRYTELSARQKWRSGE